MSFLTTDPLDTEVGDVERLIALAEDAELIFQDDEPFPPDP